MLFIQTLDAIINMAYRSKEQLEGILWRVKLRGFASATLAGIAWLLIAVIVVLRFDLSPQSEGIMLFAVAYLVGGVGVLILAVYLTGRGLLPRCPSCKYILSDQDISQGALDAGNCPQCSATIIEAGV